MHKGKASQDRYICDLFILKKKKVRKIWLYFIQHSFDVNIFNLYTESLLDRSTHI